VIECKEDKDIGSHLSIAFQKGLTLDFEVQTVLGETSPMKDSSRLATMIVSRIRSLIESQIVLPNKRRIPLAGLTKKPPQSQKSP